MKKIFTVILLVLLTFSLASCNNKGKSSSESLDSFQYKSSSFFDSSISSSSKTENSTQNQIPLSETHYIKDGYEYFLVSNSPADKSRMRVPYIENAVPNYPANYYSTTIGKSGSALKKCLASITDSLKADYDWERFCIVDEDPNNTNNIWTIYGAQSLPKTAEAHGNEPNTWNREHSFPQSLFGKSYPMKGDSNHVFADDHTTNATRSNYKYNDLENKTSFAVKDSAGLYTANFKSGENFEPMDAVKGQVARATLYMATRYASADGVSLKVTDNFKSLSLCLAWNDEFPPTSWEITRNNRVYEIQGNRNPFIDHPEFARMIFSN